MNAARDARERTRKRKNAYFFLSSCQHERKCVEKNARCTDSDERYMFVLHRKKKREYDLNNPFYI